MTKPRYRYLLAAGVLVAGVTAAATTSLTRAPEAAAIANGEDVADGRYGFSADLTMPKITRADGSTYASGCSGALIRPDWIVTAGHCLHDGNRKRISGKPRYEVVVTVGKTERSQFPGNSRRVVWVQQAVDSSGAIVADLAVAKLDKPVDGVDPVVLAVDEPEIGETLRLTGWGVTDASKGAADRATRLQTGLFEASDLVTDNASTPRNGELLLVTGSSPAANTSACPYDSGAPYFRETPYGAAELVAIEQGGPSCPHDQEERTTRIDPLAAWISATVEKPLPQPKPRSTRPARATS